MVAMSNMNAAEKSVRQQIASAITIVVQATRMSDGTRKVTSVAVITGMEESVHQHARDIHLREERIGPDGKVIRRIPADSHPSPVLERLPHFGYRPAAGPVRRAKLRSISGKEGNSYGIDHRFDIPGVCSRSSLWCLVPLAARASEQAKQVHATLDSALATDRQEIAKRLSIFARANCSAPSPGSIGGWISSSWRRGSRPCSIRPISNGAREACLPVSGCALRSRLIWLTCAWIPSHGFAGRLADGSAPFLFVLL